MSRFDFTRRSVLTTLTSLGLLSGTSSGELTANMGDSSTAENLSQTASSRRVLGVEFIHRETGENFVYSDHTGVQRDELPNGSYDVVELAEEESQVIRRTSSVHITQSVEATVDNGTELRVLAYTPTDHDFIPADGSIEIWVGAVQRENGRDAGGVSGQEITVRIENGDGTTIATESVTTDQSGNATVTVDLADADPGYHRVIAEAAGLNSVDDRFDVGTYTDMPFHWTGMTPGEETTLGIYSAQGAEPESGVSRPITVESPDGTENEFDVQIEEGGIGLFTYTPEETGEHQFRSDSEYMAGIGSADLKAITPYFELREQYINDTVSWSAFILQDREPVSNLDIEVTISEEREETAIEEFSTTTNEFGQFSISFDAPSETNVDYQIDIQTADGRSVFLFGDRVRFTSPPESTEPEPVQLNTGIDDYVVGPGSETNVTIEFTENGEPLSNTSVRLQYNYSFQEIPAGEKTVTTDADGRASTTLSIPETAPDGERMYVKAFAEANGTVYTDESSSSIEQYNYEFEDYGLERGTTNTIEFTVTNRSTGESVNNADITVFGNRYHVDTETFDAGYTQTGSDGTGTIDLAIPSDVTNDIMINEITRYSDASNSGGSISPPFSADISVSPVEPNPGESVSIEYTTDYTETVSAIAAFPSRENASAALLTENEPKELTVPSSAEPGEYLRIELLLISTDGEATTERESIQIAEGLTAAFEYEPTNPLVGETITFTDASSPKSDTALVSHEWDFSGDGSTDKTGETVSYTFEEAGSYDVSLTVTDDADNTDSVTGTISVSSQTEIPPIVGESPPQDLNGDGLYRDINGDGEVDVFDVQALYNNLSSDAVQNNAEAFSFSSGSADGEVDIFDVQALYSDIQDR